MQSRKINSMWLVALMALFTVPNFADTNASLSGNIRVGYQHGVNEIGSGDELALGVTIGGESQRWNNLLVGGSVSALGGSRNGNGGYFIHGVSNDTVLLSEAYIKGFYADSEITLGRQLLETPFANSDDIGMIPNRFGGLKIVNNAIKDTTITAGYINSMAVGTDDDRQAKFDKLGLFMAGVEYKGVEDLVLSSWYYQKQGEIRAIYLDALHSGQTGYFDYEVAAQYANQNIDNKSNNIYGYKIFVHNELSGIALSGAYTKTVGAVANNLYGGGPWYSSVEHSTIADAGDNGSATKLTIGFDRLGVNGLSLGFEKLWLKGDESVTNSGVMMSYQATKNINIRGYHNVISDERVNSRVFIDYSF